MNVTAEDIERTERELAEAYAEKERIERELEKLTHKESQLVHHAGTLRSRIADRKRKDRTHRLIERGALLESLIPNAENMTNEQIGAILISALEGKVN